MRVTIPAGAGLFADEVVQELPDGAWSDGENIRFANGYAEAIRGHVSALTAPDAAAYNIASFSIQAGNFWIHSTLTGTFADDGSTQTDITGTAHTGTADDKWTSCVLGGVYIQNNGVDAPQYWGGDVLTTLDDLPGWPASTTCKSLRSFKNYLIALNVTKSGTNYGSMVKWSHAAEPGSAPSSWDETDPTLDAGEFDMAETPDTVVDGLPLGDIFVVYKSRSMYALQYVGGNDIFRLQRLPGDHGLLSQNCAVAIPGGHVCLTASDLIIHNGAGPQSIIDGKMRRWLFSRIDSTNYKRCFVASIPARSEVWVCFPDVGQAACTTALVWNYQSQTFGVRDLPNVTAAAFGPLSSSATDEWDGDTDPWDSDLSAWDQVDVSQADQRVLMSSADSALYLMDQSMQFAGESFTSRVERKGMPLGDQSVVKVIREVIPRIDAADGTQVYIQVGGANDAERSPAWSSPVTYTVGTSYKADTFASGRYLSVRVYGTGAWRIKSFDIDFVTKGRY